ncbi:hypothetical protein [Celerinatantimonas sp. MCCC 1A17872]|uniref:hypothetical protein n=1 Tax=Celerinatantimonas sp. MCCC 1A17872 TaxID=3177514 RepID=UPI0038BF196A
MSSVYLNARPTNPSDPRTPAAQVARLARQRPTNRAHLVTAELALRRVHDSNSQR